MRRLALYLGYRTKCMKKFFTILPFLLLTSLSWGQKEYGTSPLEYNTSKYYQHYHSAIDHQAKDLYPLCSNNYYIYDTLSLPFIDDFSQNHFTTYHSWDWPVSVDSIARVYRLTPDTFAQNPGLSLLNYSLDTTRHMTYADSSLDAIDSSIVNIPRQLIIYGDCKNPFLPTDTITVWAITSTKAYFDTLTQLVIEFPIFPDGTLTADTTDTINVFFPQTNNSLWIDNFAYRNVTMGINPPTYGVVTLDGTNEFGKAYSPGGTNTYGVADYLTSKPIDLSSYSAASNIYLSFFTQPKGYGYRPDVNDSIVVEFYSPSTQQWYRQWSNIGDTLTFDTCRAFLQTVLPVNNSLFFQDGFQFRFKNWGNLSGNLDHWNIDYVRLDAGRNINDTLIQDVAFVHLPPTILRNYTSMPFRQFDKTIDLKPKWNNDLSNLFNANKNIIYGFDFRNEAGTLLNQWPTDYLPVPDVDDIITPYVPNGYSTFPGWSEPDFNYQFLGAPTYPFVDTARFTIDHYFNCTTTDVNQENDSIRLRQDFINYYSYDDGTAEQAMWLGTPGYMNIKFKNNLPDTLRAIQFYFSPIKDDANGRFITLQVYTGSMPSPTLVYQTSRQVGVLDIDPTGVVNEINNGFTTYLLTDTFVALPAGDFFVGWYQSQTFKLNVGFDKNLDNKSRTYYRTSGVWDTLTVDGTIMVRAVMGKALVETEIGIEEFWDSESINLYPNPSSDLINYSIQGNINLSTIRIVDITGKLVYHSTNINSNQIDISTFAPGIYFMQFVSNESPQPVTKKFIVAR